MTNEIGSFHPVSNLSTFLEPTETWPYRRISKTVTKVGIKFLVRSFDHMVVVAIKKKFLFLDYLLITTPKSKVQLHENTIQVRAAETLQSNHTLAAVNTLGRCLPTKRGQRTEQFFCLGVTV